MKNARSILWLSAALLATLAAHVFLSMRGGALVRRTNLLDPDSGMATRIELSRAGSPATVLERAGSWRLVAPYSAEVDERTVLKMLDALMATDVEDSLGDFELLRLGRTREDLGLAPTPRVSLRVSGGGVEGGVSLGSATPSGDGVYAAVSGEDFVHVVPSNVLAAVDLPPEGFRRRSLFPAGAEAAVALDIRRGAGSFMRFVRDGEMWKMSQPHEAPASSGKVKALLSNLMSASASGFVWPTGADGEPKTPTAALLAGYGLDPESAVTVTVRCADGVDRQVSFGKEAGGGLVYALAENASAVVTVDAALKDAALAETSEFTDGRLFPFDEQSVARFSVEDGDTVYLLARGDDGAWLLDAPVAAATDAAGVSALLSRILALKAGDADPDGIKVSVSTNAPSATVSRKALLGDLRLEDLRSREVLRVDPAGVRRVVVTRGDCERHAAVQYDKDRRAWNVESSSERGVVDAQAVEGIVAALGPLKAEAVVKLKVSSADLKSFGLDAPWLTVAVDLDREGSARKNVLVGAAASERGARYATVGASDAVFVLSAETVERLSAPIVAESR